MPARAGCGHESDLNLTDLQVVLVRRCPWYRVPPLCPNCVIVLPLCIVSPRRTGVFCRSRLMSHRSRPADVPILDSDCRLSCACTTSIDYVSMTVSEYRSCE
ncbi:hypothetical protein J6590_043737, partial [Homalodisca vitripennis]